MRMNREEDQEIKTTSEGRERGRYTKKQRKRERRGGRTFTFENHIFVQNVELRALDINIIRKYDTEEGVCGMRETEERDREERDKEDKDREERKNTNRKWDIKFFSMAASNRKSRK